MIFSRDHLAQREKKVPKPTHRKDQRSWHESKPTTKTCLLRVVYFTFILRFLYSMMDVDSKDCNTQSQLPTRGKIIYFVKPLKDCEILLKQKILIVSDGYKAKLVLLMHPPRKTYRCTALIRNLSEGYLLLPPHQSFINDSAE